MATTLPLHFCLDLIASFPPDFLLLTTACQQIACTVRRGFGPRWCNRRGIKLVPRMLPFFAEVPLWRPARK